MLLTPNQSPLSNISTDLSKRVVVVPQLQAYQALNHAQVTANKRGREANPQQLLFAHSEIVRLVSLMLEKQNIKGNIQCTSLDALGEKKVKMNYKITSNNDALLWDKRNVWKVELLNQLNQSQIFKDEGMSVEYIEISRGSIILTVYALLQTQAATAIATAGGIIGLVILIGGVIIRHDATLIINHLCKFD